MRSQYAPSDSVVCEHLEHTRKTAHLPVWQRGLSVQLLLGLRDPEIDSELKAIFQQVPDDGDYRLESSTILDAVSDTSVKRLIRLAAGTGNPLSFAWARLEPREVTTAIRELIPLIRSLPRFNGVPAAVYVTLCELVDRFGTAESLSELEYLERPKAWVSSATFARVKGTATP